MPDQNSDAPAEAGETTVTPAAEPVVELAPVEPAAAESAPNSSPTELGTNESAAVEQAAATPSPETEPSTPVVLNPPTPQPPLPGPDAFDSHGEPSPTVIPAEKRAVYVDGKGREHNVTVCAQREDGSVDIMMPATVGGYRVDAVRKQQDPAQVGNFIK